MKDRSEALAWLGASRKGAEHIPEAAAAGWTFEAIGDEWLAGVEAGRIGRRRGRGKPYSPTTIEDYRRSYRQFLRPEIGPMVGDEISELEWQMWVDRLSRDGLSRSRIAGHASVASAIYAWGMSPSRRHATRNPLRLVELPPSDEKPRLRVALAPEAAQLLAALDEPDALPYAIAFYAGLRRSEIHRLEWPEILEGDDIASRLLVTRSKSEAGRERRPPIAEPLRVISRHSMGATGSPKAPAGVRAQRDVWQARRARDRGLERGGPSSTSHSTSADTRTPRC